MARIITPEAALSYPNVFEPRSVGNGPEKYSAAFVFPEGTDLSELEQAAAKALKEAFGKKATPLLKAVMERRKGERKDGELKVGGLRWPIRTDWESKGYPEGSVFFNARSQRPPQIVSTVPDENGQPSKVTDETKVYPGVIVKASVDVFTYDNESKGVTFGLGNIQIIRDGERLDGVQHASEEFEADPEAVPDLSDLTDEEDDGDDEALAGVAAESGGAVEDEDDLSDLLG